MTNGDARFHGILKELADLHGKKAADYGRGPGCLCQRPGFAGMEHSPVACRTLRPSPSSR